MASGFIFISEEAQIKVTSENRDCYDNKKGSQN